MKIQKIKDSYFVCLPKAIVIAKGWERGDKLKVEFDSKGNIVLKKKTIL